MTMHTMEEDFQHFLSYSGLADKPHEIIALMRMAFEAAWEPKELREFIEEISLHPYKDSDLESLLETYRARAQAIL